MGSVPPCRMRVIFMGYCSLLLYQAVQAWGLGGLKKEDDDNFGEERKLINLLKDVKRTDWFQALCGKWDDWCLPDTQKPGLSCCEGYTCKCNLWDTNCRCEAKHSMANRRHRAD